MSVRVELIRPNVALVIPTDGSPQFGWLRKLNASARNSIYGRFEKWNSFDNEKSQFSIPGPIISLRPAVPNVPFGAREYAAVLNHLSIVGLSSAVLMLKSRL